MRLQHPERGTLPPAEIVGIAEENGSIGRIGDAILSKSLASLAIISKLEGLADSYLAVNFSPLQFEPALPARLAALLLDHGITPSRIVIEITEAVLMLDNPVVREVLDALSDPRMPHRARRFRHGLFLAVLSATLSHRYPQGGPGLCQRHREQREPQDRGRGGGARPQSGPGRGGRGRGA